METKVFNSTLFEKVVLALLAGESARATRLSTGDVDVLLNHAEMITEKILERSSI